MAAGLGELVHVELHVLPTDVLALAAQELDTIQRADMVWAPIDQVARREVAVIPIALGGLWGSWFSRRTGGGVRKIPGRLFARVPITVGKAIPATDVTAESLELLVRPQRGDDR